VSRSRPAVLVAGLAAALVLGGCAAGATHPTPAPAVRELTGPSASSDPSFACDQGADGLPVCEGDVPASVGPYRTPDGVLVGG
jgi:hypothetical protein